jgi:hypothetical protein
MAFQMLGATLHQAGISDSRNCYAKPWKDLGIAMRNSSLNYDLNARYSNAMRQYNQEMQAWESAGKPRGQKPSKPSRITILLRDNMLTSAYRGAQQVIKANLARLQG